MTSNPGVTLSDLNARVLAACADLARLTEVPGTTTRPYLCPSTRDVHAFLFGWAARLGLSVRVDAVGNLRARREGPAPDAPTLYVGSHIDTVPNAGAFDGVLGVLLAFALAEAVQERPLPFALELVAFSEEEGVRYGVPFIGSRALTGTADDLLGLTDAEGQTVADAIMAFGLNPDHLPDARVHGQSLGFLEFHIEQGPVLQAAGAALGVVSAIVGQNRVLLDFTGQASHAGTTPMAHRKDALAAAARFVVAAEELARSTPGLVATVGIMHARPGAINIVPGEVHCTLDLRHPDDAVRLEKLHGLLEGAQHFAAERGVTLTVSPMMGEDATPMDAGLRDLLHRAAGAEGAAHPELVSGAGHDAMILATVMPAAMLFIRSPNALSHHPDEMVNSDDVEAALRVGVRFLDVLAQEVGA
ncbi:allantoate deiminase [Deinococcus metalli]|uniref:Allantoate deiminase n=1 Tax=Deinococcus metalli TaxID=1141878 RepID=A0A7W8NQK1_9DEIO|nr:allantoate amidohydrolase [Deinococcus metalli]MBB5376880.1 allantoate deiminase [Deinococcus metalli]GHF46038.1 Zn-dependent hydrolase [Deinococcus metalli]